MIAVTVEKGSRVASVRAASIERALQLPRRLGREYLAQEERKKGVT
jgi:hypothetical protein